MLLQKFLSRKISPEKSLDFWSQKSVLRPALLARFSGRIRKSKFLTHGVLSGNCHTARGRSMEDETRNAELNGNRNPEWWGDFSHLVKIEKIKFLGISRYKVELRF